jgi:DNA-directed RNA polymerase subunit F
MSGEEPSTMRLSDAIHWMEVYEELIRVKDDLIETAVSRLATLAPESSDEIRGSDLVLLQAERARFEARLAFWKNRHRELEGLTDSS